MPKFKKNLKGMKPSGFKMRGWGGYQNSPMNREEKELTEKPVVEGDGVFDPRSSAGTYSSYRKSFSKQEKSSGVKPKSRSWYDMMMRRASKTGEAGYTGANLARTAQMGGTARPWWEEEEDLSVDANLTTSAMTKKKSPKRNYKVESPLRDTSPHTGLNPPHTKQNHPLPKMGMTKTFKKKPKMGMTKTKKPKLKMGMTKTFKKK